MKTLRVVPLGLCALAVSSAPAGATTLSTTSAHARSCHAKVLRTADHLRVTSPVNGMVSARLTAARGDWDLAVFDARTRRAVAASAGFHAKELAEGYVRKGQRLLVQGCRFRGARSAAAVRVTFESAGGSAGGARAAASRGPIQLVEVLVASQADKRRLQGLDLDLTEHGDANSVEVVLWGSADAATLRANKFRFRVRIADLSARSAADAEADRRFAAVTGTSDLPSGRDGYRRLADYDLELKQLALQYPGLAKPITLSNRSWEGREINGIEITQNPNAADGKPIFLNMGVHHAREWPSAENAMEFAYDLLRNYGTDARTTDLVNAARTIVVPVVNPDGFNVSREARAGNPKQDFGLHDFEMKRKNCRDVAFKCDKVSRLRGVDPNRNYGGLWGGPGASPNAGSDVYRGPAPFSEPEIQAVKDLVGKRQVVTLISNHTFSNLILRSPGTVDQGFPLEEDQQRELGARMAAHNGYANVPGFGLYDTTGTTEDWTFWTAGALSYTFEIGGIGFHPPYADAVVAEYLGRAPAEGAGLGGNREAYYEALQATADATLHSVITGSAPAGSQVTVSKTFDTRTSAICQNEFCTTTAPAITFPDSVASSMITDGGTFAFHVNPSTRPDVAGRYGRDPTGPPQAGFALANPAGFPAENTAYPVPDTGAQEQIPFTVQGSADGVDNGRITVHIEWADAANDWDLYLLGPAGEIVAQSAAFGDTTEDVMLLDPPAGEYTAVVINYDQVSRTPDDWTGSVAFQSPTPQTIGTTEAWTLTCTPPGGGTASRPVTVGRGQSVDVGEACQA